MIEKIFIIVSKELEQDRFEYLEKYFKENKTDIDREYIDVFWTNIYCNAANGAAAIDIQSYLNSIDTNKKYFTICQHDDGPMEKLPADTLIFSAGGNREGDNIIPIPMF